MNNPNISNQEIVEIFREKVSDLKCDLDFSVLTGSRAANKNKPTSDVDILTVVSPNEETPAQIARFARLQVETQIELGLTPDYEYPCDIISRDQLSDTLEGRCLRNEDGRLVTDQTSTEFDYRVWLYEMIIHNFDLLGGSNDKLVAATRSALQLTLSIIIAQADLCVINMDILRKIIIKPGNRDYELNQNQTDLLVETIGGSDLFQVKQGIIYSDPIEVRSALRAKIRQKFYAKGIVDWEELRRMFV